MQYAWGWPRCRGAPRSCLGTLWAVRLSLTICISASPASCLGADSLQLECSQERRIANLAEQDVYQSFHRMQGSSGRGGATLLDCSRVWSHRRSGQCLEPTLKIVLTFQFLVCSCSPSYYSALKIKTAIDALEIYMHACRTFTAFLKRVLPKVSWEEV